MAQIFISYSRKDLSFVERLAADLKNAGFDVWYDLASLGGGSRWGREIEAAIKKSRYVIVVLSPASVASEWVEREFLFASNRKRKIIPLLYYPCELSINYLDLNYIDVQGENYEKNFGELLEALDVDVSKRSTPASAAPSKLPLGLTARQVALIGTAAATVLVLVVAAIIWFNGRSQAPTETPAPVVTTLSPTQQTPTESTPTEPTPTDTATPTPTSTATPTPSLIPTDSPTPTATQTPTTPPSAYTIYPPTIDGIMRIPNWEDALVHLVAPLPLGNLYYLNDDQYLYLLVDVIKDNDNDLYLNGVRSEDGNKSYDDLTIGFDVNKDKIQNSSDVYYFYSGHAVTLGYFKWRDECSDITPEPEATTSSKFASGFEISIDPHSDRHKFWEVKIKLDEIGGKLGEDIYAGVRVASYQTRPFTFEDSVPSGFGFPGFCRYDKRSDSPIKIHLYKELPDL